MKHQVFSTYYNLYLEGKIEPLKCVNQEHLAYLIPYWDILKERSEFRCPVNDCDYKIVPGLAFYEKILKETYIGIFGKNL